MEQIFPFNKNMASASARPVHIKNIKVACCLFLFIMLPRLLGTADGWMSDIMFLFIMLAFFTTPLLLIISSTSWYYSKLNAGKSDYFKISGEKLQYIHTRVSKKQNFWKELYTFDRVYKIVDKRFYIVVYGDITIEKMQKRDWQPGKVHKIKVQKSFNNFSAVEGHLKNLMEQN